MKELSRKEKFVLNTFLGIVKQFIVVVCGFILPRYLLIYYGSSVNGLISSITNFLNFITLLDMGVGAVVQANLYKPLAEKDGKQISRIVKSSSRFFRRLAYIFIGYIIVLSIILPNFLNEKFTIIYTISLIVIISISTLVQYLFGITYQLLLNADQRSYVPLILQAGTIFLNTILSIVLMKVGVSVHIMKLMTSLVYVVRPIGQMLYVKVHYQIDSTVNINDEPIKQKWNGFSQHFAAVVCQNIDVVILTLFSSFEKVSVYSVYYNVTFGIEQIIMTAANGLESLFGNMIARNENEQLLKTFNMIEWGVHVGVTIIFTVAAITIVPFISVYTRDIIDTNYILPMFGIFLVIAYGMQCLRVPYFRLIKAAGHFKETQRGAYISAFLNIIITTTLVFRFGLIGTAIGTLVAMSYHTCYFVYYLQNNILYRNIKHFVGYMFVDIFVAIMSFVFTKGFMMEKVTYTAWILFAVKVTVVVLMISLGINLIVYKAQVVGIIQFFKQKRIHNEGEGT